MGKRANDCIILIGFSATGKSKVGWEVASRLGWDVVDTDEEVVRLAGKSIQQIFAQDGEKYFRGIERQALIEACKKREVVVATGGGAVLDPHNRTLMKESGVVICLESSPETIYHRLLKDNEASGAIRPLLAVSNPLEQIKQLKESRQPYYAIADWTVHTDNLTLDEVCQEIIRGRYYWARAHKGSDGCLYEEGLGCEVITAAEHYPVYVGWGLLHNLGENMRQARLTGTAYLVSDETVFSIYGATVTESLQNTGLAVEHLLVSPGETTKTLETAARIYDWLIDRRTERGDVIIALGGGMVGDLVGFVAATFLRGLPLVQVPTSLVAMVDASIGGKTAVNHSKAKNLIGVFYQPCIVVADVQALTSLAKRELVSGWAEVIKHGLVLDPELFTFLECNVERLLVLDPEAATEAIRRSVAVKARIVSEDEREQRGRRILLNYGHTIGHALEAATNYEQFLHGEAVAIGMVGAAMISYSLGLLSEEVVERQRILLSRFGLSTCCSGVDMNAVLRAMELDKKVKAKTVRWVLLEGVGQPVVRHDIPYEQVAKVLERLLVTG